MLDQRREPLLHLLDRFRRAFVHAQIAFEKCPEWPRPDRAVVISLIALELRAAIVRAISRIGGAERAKPVRREQLSPHHLDHRALLIWIQRTVRKTRGED